MLAHAGPSWPQVGPKLAPSWPMLAQVGPNWFKLAPNWPQDAPKWAYVGSCWPQIGPMMPHPRPFWAFRTSSLVFPDWTFLMALSIAPLVLPGCLFGRPKCLQGPPRRPQTSPKAPQGVPKGSSKAFPMALKDFVKILQRPRKNNGFSIIF